VCEITDCKCTPEQPLLVLCTRADSHRCFTKTQVTHIFRADAIGECPSEECTRWSNHQATCAAVHLQGSASLSCCFVFPASIARSNLPWDEAKIHCEMVNRKFTLALLISEIQSCNIAEAHSSPADNSTQLCTSSLGYFQKCSNSTILRA
jgi:hypothetical protein